MAAAVEAVPTMPTMPAPSRCQVWGERYGTDGNGTSKSDESFS
jgi:hypothetical protein